MTLDDHMQTSDWRRDPAMAALGMAAFRNGGPKSRNGSPRNGGPPEWRAVPHLRTVQTNVRIIVHICHIQYNTEQF